MLKMFKILPGKIKAQFGIGILIVIINVALTMMLPILLSQFLPLLINDTNGQDVKLELFSWTVMTGTWNEVFTTLMVSFILTLFFAATTSFGYVLIIIWAGEKASNFYRNSLFKKYQKLSLKDIAQLTNESLITRINDDVAVFWDFLIGASISLIKAPLYIVVGLVFAFMTDVPLTFSIIAVIPLLIVVIAYMFIKVNPLIKKNRKNLDWITKEVDESINGARFIKANNLQHKQYAKFNKANTTWLGTEKSIYKYFSIGMPAFFVIINAIIVIIYAIGKTQLVALAGDGKIASDGAQLIAKLNVFIEYEVLIAQGVIMFSQFLGSFFRAKISAGRIVEVLDKEYDDLHVAGGLMISQNPKATSKDYSIEFKNVNYKYFETSQDYSIQDINFRIEGGQTLGIIGPTGSGKSTIANLIVNNMKYTEGNVLINGKEVRDINTTDLHQNVGIVYQEALLYSGTVLSNLTFGKEDATQEQIDRALKASCSNNFIMTFPDRLQHAVVQRGKNLSGGQKQRLSIARSLIIDPKILILDDSTSALDNITTKALIKNIKEDYDCTTVIISQKINSIKHADKILVMDKGKIIAQGKHEELLVTCPWYRDINANQLEQ
ncbi:ABC transporter ATP-binding protein [Mycoplasma seminis]|uniref:ABC transporter ATP-binding protein n=1 Tax=Mycoplasma seminis TaxID=512749 RepID=A0ABY9HAI3_9MOLU|nr:ABC transporter ATP-binding protein [Mycoplasma seminis]WLP85614.1 ABC transporter ATP-binding protein [Mycoplasma seminis]